MDLEVCQFAKYFEIAKTFFGIYLTGKEKFIAIEISQRL